MKKTNRTDRLAEARERLTEISERSAATARALWLASLGLAATVAEATTEAVDEWAAEGKRAGRSQGRSASAAAEALRARLDEAAAEWNRTLEKGVAAVLHRVGVPTRNEMQALRRRVDALQAAVHGETR